MCIDMCADMCADLSTYIRLEMRIDLHAVVVRSLTELVYVDLEEMYLIMG